MLKRSKGGELDNIVDKGWSPGSSMRNKNEGILAKRKLTSECRMVGKCDNVTVIENKKKGEVGGHFR